MIVQRVIMKSESVWSVCQWVMPILILPPNSYIYADIYADIHADIHADIYTVFMLCLYGWVMDVGQ